MDFYVTFSESVTGVDTSDFSLTTPNTADGSVSQIAGSGTSYTVTVNSITGDGILLLDLSDNDSIISNDTNTPLGGVGTSGDGDGSYIIGQDYTIDTTAPEMTSLTPVDEATQALVNGNLVMQFNETIFAKSGSVTIYQATDEAIFEAIDITGPQVTINAQDVTIDPSYDLEGDSSYYVQVDSTALEDLAGNPYVGFSDSTSWNFHTEITNLPPQIALPGDSTYLHRERGGGGHR